MEKSELIKNLYDLRMALLLLAIKCDEIEKRNRFDEACRDEKMYYSNQTDPYVTSVYQYNVKTYSSFNPNDNVPWQAYNNWVKMYGLDKEHILIKGLQFIPDYVFLFDHMAKKPIFDKYWKQVMKKTIVANSPFDGRRIVVRYPRFHGTNPNIELAMDNFNMLNINVLKIKKEICEDALSNKKSPLLKLYKEKEIEKYFIPKIDYLIKHRADAIKTAEKACMKKYGVAIPRTKAEINIDKETIKQVKEATQILNKNYSFLSKSDWNDIDGLIFFLESGRADTLKEALNLNDMKKYKDEIVASVDRVNKTVIQGIAAIRSDLNVYFNTLFDKLDALNDSLAVVAKEISRNTAAIHYSSDQICRMIYLTTN